MTARACDLNVKGTTPPPAGRQSLGGAFRYGGVDLHGPTIQGNLATTLADPVF